VTGARACFVSFSLHRFCAFPADPQKEIVDVTVNGTQNVLGSCAKAAKAGTLRRYVQISSIAAVQVTIANF
jgi:hypothetical protein